MRYRIYLQLEKSLQPNTVEAYIGDVNKLLAFFGDVDRMLAVTLDDLREFLSAMADVGVNARSQARIISSLRSFYGFLKLDGYIGSDPTAQLRSPKIGMRLPDVLTLQEIDDIMNDKDNRQELETLTPSILLKNGEPKFRQRFELLYPLFLPRLRERVPAITRREELLSMLIVLKQDNKEIAELMAIAPRSVLMLRHRLRQKIGISTDNSLENYIEEILEFENKSDKGADSPVQD